jgi:hypothetical protein
VNGANFAHITDNTPTNACLANPASATPVWISASNPQPVPPVNFTLGLPANVCSVTLPVPLIPGPNLLPLTPGQTYTLSFCDGSNQCSQAITLPESATATDPSYTAGSGTCGIGDDGGTIAVGAKFPSGTACTCP